MKVIVHLVNDKGQPYRGSTPTSLSISEGTNVDAFRDAVKGKCPNLLASTDASQLKVYTTVAALLGDEGVPWLDEDAILGELKIGLSKKDALAVVVPTTQAGGL